MAINKPIAQEFFPWLIACPGQRAEGGTHCAVCWRRLTFGAFAIEQLAVVAEQCQQDLEFGHAIRIEREDHGLHRGVGAAARAGICPRFEVMGGGNVPSGGMCRGIAALSEMNAGFEFRETFPELQVRQSVVKRIGWGEQHQGFDGACVDIRLEAGQSAETRGFRLDGREWLVGTEVAQHQVDGQGQVVECGGLARTGEHQRFAWVGLEIFDDTLHPGNLLLVSERRNFTHQCRVADDASGNLRRHR